VTDFAMSCRALVAGSLLTIACHERGSSESGAAPSASVGEPGVPAARVVAPPLPSVRAEIDLKAEVTALRDALLKKDRAGFARAMAYPVRINTNSRCWVLLRDSPAFLKHFDEIVSPTVERAIRTAKPDGSYRQGLAGGAVWLQQDDPPVIFNSEVWDIPGEPCDNWQVEPTPRWLHGNWVFAAVAGAEPTSDHASPSRWQNASLRIDLDAGTATLALRPGHARKCRPLVFGRTKNYAALKLEPAAYGYTEEDGQFLNLECDVHGTHGSVERIYVRNEGSLIANADIASFVALRPSALVTPGLPATQGRACSSSAPRCEPPLVCRMSTSFVAAPQRNTVQFVCESMLQ
jgi:hypothetical protein